LENKQSVLSMIHFLIKNQILDLLQPTFNFIQPIHQAWK
jgi:hypothetical protein